MLFHLIAAHFVCDYALQTAYIAESKGVVLRSWLDKHFPAKAWLTRSMVSGYGSAAIWSDWFWPLLAHSFVHGLAVAVITNSVELGIAETIMHFGIDFTKTAWDIPTTADQICHLNCKVVWWILARS